CALSTAPGAGAIALIRISGPQAVGIAGRMFQRTLEGKGSHQAIHGWIVDGDERIDEVMLTMFLAPRSYTGEDTVEIACHGSIYIQQRLLELAMRYGARMAQPGEYTLRAFMHGKMDLSQAEAIGDLIASESAAAHKQAVHQMRGGFSREIDALRSKLIHFASMVELELDFSEEDVEFANRDQLRSLVTEIQGVVNHLKDSFRLGGALRNGVPVAIIGAPNAGKSTLLNALLNEERAIVSDIAGTTRDTIEEQLIIEGVRFRFIDTAGIRETTDHVERIGITRALEKAHAASVILLIFDATTTSYEKFNEFRAFIRKEAGEDKWLIGLANKCDATGFDAMVFDKHFASDPDVLKISALRGVQLDRLKELLKSSIDMQRIHSGETLVMNARHHGALQCASEALQECLQGLDAGVSGDLLAVDIRRTLYHLGEITGQVSADDVLNNIFSSFCIGK
ncbi:MAG: tRNA uridine-5-carboxymethylaminomethyl(34) synthesis GTPase MnmE, partial [Flavobacteriales bacterium]